MTEPTIAELLADGHDKTCAHVCPRTDGDCWNDDWCDADESIRHDCELDYEGTD